jgi:hypothetical protein
MGRPGNRWKVEFTRKYVPSTRIREGSGANPGMMGLMADMLLTLVEAE